MQYINRYTGSHTTDSHQLPIADHKILSMATLPLLHATDVENYTGSGTVLTKSTGAVHASKWDIWNHSAKTSRDTGLTANTRNKRAR
jgi:hypothetical protein